MKLDLVCVDFILSRNVTKALQLVPKGHSGIDHYVHIESLEQLVEGS